MTLHRHALPLLLGALIVSGCGEPSTPSDPPPAAAHDHSSLSKHGGALVELGDHAALLEVVHDETAGVVTVHVMDMQGRPVTPDAAPVLNIVVDGTPRQITGVGEAGTWTFTDDVLKGHADGARLRIAVAGSTFSPDLPHQH